MPDLGMGWISFIRGARNTTQVLTAARIVRTPPSRILSIPSHATVNAGCFALGVICLMMLRVLFSQGGNVGVLPSTLMTALSFIFLIGCGLLVNLVVTDKRPLPAASVPVSAADTANKWATYNIIGFILTIAIYTSLSLLVWLVTGESAINWLAEAALARNYPGSPDTYNFVAICVCACCAFLIIFAKTERSCGIAVADHPEVIAAFLFGGAVVSATVYFFGFVDF